MKRVQTKCFRKTLYKYTKCSDPFGKQYSFRNWKGRGHCGRTTILSKRKLHNRYRRKNALFHGYLYKAKRVSTYCKQVDIRTNSTQFNSRYGVYNGHLVCYPGAEYGKDGNGTLYYQFTGCGSSGAGGSGHFLRAVVSEFVLKGKLKKYHQQIQLIFKSIRQHYQGRRYVIRKKARERNRMIYVQFFLGSRHYVEATDDW